MLILTGYGAQGALSPEVQLEGVGPESEGCKNGGHPRLTQAGSPSAGSAAEPAVAKQGCNVVKP